MVPDTTPRPDRRSVRTKYYDYSQPGFYLVTICVENRQCIFGEVREGAMHLNAIGLIAQSLWESLPQRFSAVRLDSFVMMPNHVHGIIELIPCVGTPDRLESISHAPRFQASMGSEAVKKANPPLGQVIRAFKGVVTHDIRKAGQADFTWQKGYYESVLRNDKALDHARNYIMNNPLTWLEDSLRA